VGCAHQKALHNPEEVGRAHPTRLYFSCIFRIFYKAKEVEYFNYPDE